MPGAKPRVVGGTTNRRMRGVPFRKEDQRRACASGPARPVRLGGVPSHGLAGARSRARLFAVACPQGTGDSARARQGGRGGAGPVRRVLPRYRRDDRHRPPRQAGCRWHVQAHLRLPPAALVPGDVVRTDAAGATHRFARACVEAGCGFSSGSPITVAVRDAILALSEEDWSQAIEEDGSLRDGALVAEVTRHLGLGLPHRPSRRCRQAAPLDKSGGARWLHGLQCGMRGFCSADRFGPSRVEGRTTVRPPHHGRRARRAAAAAACHLDRGAERCR